MYLKNENQISQEKVVIGGKKTARKTFGFDEISLVPGKITLDFELCDTSFILGKHKFEFPVIASAMDSVVSPKTAVLINKLGGLAVLNLQGIYTRYENCAEVLKKISDVDNESFVPLMQELYKEPIQNHLVEMLSNLTAMQAMVYRLSQLQHDEKLTDEHAALAKVFCSLRTRDIVSRAREVMGGNGILLQYDVARFVADAEAIYSYEGTKEINTLIVGRAITGYSAFV